MTTLHVDVFVKHPLPKPLESFTSLLKRTLSGIGIDTVDAAILLCFPNLDRRSTRSVNDFGLKSYDRLPTRLNQTISVIERSTFKHLAMKFGRSTHPQAISRFLSGSVTLTLRWCPYCLGESDYCLLPWQFQSLVGCPVHQVELRSLCSNCNQTIPLFKAPLRVDICPNCKTYLPSQNTVLLSSTQIIETEKVYKELAFLLTPQEWDTLGVKLTSYVGRCLASIRLDERLSLRDMAKVSGLSVTALNGIEMSKPTLYGAPFRNYWELTRFFNIYLSDVFQHAVAQVNF